MWRYDLSFCISLVTKSPGIIALCGCPSCIQEERLLHRRAGTIMARRISPSQLRSQIRQAQSKIRQAQNKQRQALNKYNQAVRTYNSKVRSHNARVKANRERLRRELQKLARSISRPQYATFRTSVETVRRSYSALEERAEANLYDDRYNNFLDLSEREAANSVSVINALQGQTPENEPHGQNVSSEIENFLSNISHDVRDRWRGALFALNPRNPDAARHFCTSAREILTAILERYAEDGEVTATLSDCELTPQSRTPTRRSKIRFLLYRHGISDDALTEFIENDMENVVQLFDIFNKGTHGSSGRFTHSQLQSIRARVEDAVYFLSNIVSGNVF